MEKVIRVHVDLATELKIIQDRLVKKINRKFEGLDIRLPANAASKVAAAKLNKKKKLGIRLRRKGMNKGYIEFL